MQWVDDVMSSTIGIQKLINVLQIVDDFAAKNKLEWGEAKCQVMQVGRKCKVPDEWQLGDKRIKNATSYRYQGEMLKYGEIIGPLRWAECGNGFLGP